MEDTNVELDILQLVICKKVALAQDSFLLELRNEARTPLPEFFPGAHVIVQVPNGMRRNYSLCGAPEDRGAYRIAVKREAAGRGGSQSLVDDTKEGDTLEVSVPCNSFQLSAKVTNFIFVAGGIGITPILSMVRYVAKEDSMRWKLHYCTRDLASTAFRDELCEIAGQCQNGEVNFYHGSGEQARSLDLWSVFENPKKNCNIYCCGPIRLMDGVRDTTGHWPRGSVHFESFGVGKTNAQNRPFKMRLNRAGETFEVPADRSILDVLRSNGYAVRSSCESGTCGTCRTRLVAGIAEHRDIVLRDDEKADQIMPCVSRAAGDILVLDM